MALDIAVKDVMKKVEETFLFLGRIRESKDPYSKAILSGLSDEMMVEIGIHCHFFVFPFANTRRCSRHSQS